MEVFYIDSKAAMNKELIRNELNGLFDEFRKNNNIPPDVYEKYDVKRGLRNADGTGVVAGVTLICNVKGYEMAGGKKQPAPGELVYRGIDVVDIVDNCAASGRYGFEETIWLLLMGTLPTARQLEMLYHILSEFQYLPEFFLEDMILKAPSKDVMNKLGRSVLALYSYDDSPEDMSLENSIRQSLKLISRMPSIMVHAYNAKRRAYQGKSMHFHLPKPKFTTAQNILRMMRPDKKFREEEAMLLDQCLILHADHGGGNNSTFSTRCLTSTGTDIYSAIAAGIGSLKGPRHGGANIKVLEMVEMLKRDIGTALNDANIKDYLVKVVKKQAGDRTGLIYGMGHAVYTVSDPRGVILRKKSYEHAKNTKYERDWAILDAIERLAPAVLEELKGRTAGVCANVDLYSGLVYEMLNIPPDLYTPLFAVSRTAGWCAHRIEENMFGGKIMRPAYKTVAEPRKYIPINDR